MNNFEWQLKATSWWANSQARHQSQLKETNTGNPLIAVVIKHLISSQHMDGKNGQLEETLCLEVLL